jgi:hypothetical protein
MALAGKGKETRRRGRDEKAVQRELDNRSSACREEGQED